MSQFEICNINFLLHKLKYCISSCDCTFRAQIIMPIRCCTVSLPSFHRVSRARKGQKFPRSSRLFDSAFEIPVLGYALPFRNFGLERTFLITIFCSAKKKQRKKKRPKSFVIYSAWKHPSVMRYYCVFCKGMMQKCVSSGRRPSNNGNRGNFLLKETVNVGIKLFYCCCGSAVQLHFILNRELRLNGNRDKCTSALWANVLSLFCQSIVARMCFVSPCKRIPRITARFISIASIRRSSVCVICILPLTISCVCHISHHLATPFFAYYGFNQPSLFVVVRVWIEIGIGATGEKGRRRHPRQPAMDIHFSICFQTAPSHGFPLLEPNTWDISSWIMKKGEKRKTSIMNGVRARLNAMAKQILDMKEKWHM